MSITPKIRQFKATSGNQTVQLSTISAGGYILQLITKDGQVYNQQVVK